MDSPDLKWNSHLVSLASSYSGKHPLSSPQPMVRTTSDTNFTDFSRIFQGQITVFKEKDLLKNSAFLILP